jgi:hydrogenase nickel incorporation protein HypA/HybF
MHELSIAMSILEIAAEESRRRGHPRIAAPHWKPGPLAGVERKALLSAYRLARVDAWIKLLE